MIGIYGGTFDPIHYGHLRTALEVFESLALSQLRFLPCGQPAHRPKPVASPEQRLHMLQLAIQNLDPSRFCIDPRELHRSGPSYSYDTLLSLREELGSEPLCLIIGRDAFLGLTGWYRWKELLKLTHLVVMTRPGHHGVALHPDLATLQADHSAEKSPDWQKQACGAIQFVPVSPLEISSTAIRGQLAEGKSPRFLLPDAVLEWIGEQGIYAAPKI